MNYESYENLINFILHAQNKIPLYNEFLIICGKTNNDRLRLQDEINNILGNCNVKYQSLSKRPTNANVLTKKLLVYNFVNNNSNKYIKAPTDIKSILCRRNELYYNGAMHVAQTNIVGLIDTLSNLEIELIEIGVVVTLC